MLRESLSEISADFQEFFYDFDIYDDILHVSKKKYQKRQIFQTAKINVLSLHVYAPLPPLAPDPGTLAHRNHAHMLPALVEILLSH